jgi:hypothetical protein
MIACIHVDDMMLTAKESEDIDDVINELHKIYPSLTIKRDNNVNYLAVGFDFDNAGKVKITTEKHIDDVLNECEDVNG